MKGKFMAFKIPWWWKRKKQAANPLTPAAGAAPMADLQQVRAALQVKLGISLAGDPRGNRGDNLEQAIHHYQEALTVSTREAFPLDWAMIQNNLGIAYGERLRGERVDNLEQAIHHFTQALTARTRDACPEDWAQTQHNLANAYADRLRGERADNLERAIAYLEEALTVVPREAFPSQYRTMQRGLGHLHLERQDWAPAHVAYAAAIEAGADLLAAAYTLTGRQAEVAETARAYAYDAYTLMRLGRPGEGLLRLEHGKARLLGEELALAALDLIMLPEADQEDVRLSRQAVQDLEAVLRRPADTAVTPARLRQMVVPMAEMLRESRAVLNRRIESIRAEHPEFMPSGLDLPDLLALIPEGGALVAPVFTLKGSAVLVLPTGRQQ